MSNELKFLSSWKPIPHFLIIQYDELRYCPESIF